MSDFLFVLCYPFYACGRPYKNRVKPYCLRSSLCHVKEDVVKMSNVSKANSAVNYNKVLDGKNLFKGII
jgi:hypothetical protein